MLTRLLLLTGLNSCIDPFLYSQFINDLSCHFDVRPVAHRTLVHPDDVAKTAELLRLEVDRAEEDGVKFAVMSHSSSARALLSVNPLCDAVFMLDPVKSPYDHVPLLVSPSLILHTDYSRRGFSPPGHSGHSFFEALRFAKLGEYVELSKMGHSDILDPAFALGGALVGIKSGLNFRLAREVVVGHSILFLQLVRESNFFKDYL